jgi:hypothetical protein
MLNSFVYYKISTNLEIMSIEKLREKMDKLREKMATQTVYLENTFEEIAIKRNKGADAKFFAKPKGGKEYPIVRSSQVVAEAILEGSEITELQYINY